VVLPDLTEPRQTAEKTRSRVDALAPKPGWAAGYHMPPRGTPEWYAMGLIDQLLLQGDDSRLQRTLVREKAITGDLSGGINADLGNMYNYNGPMLWRFNFTHDAQLTDAQIRAAVDPVIAGLSTTPVPQAELDRARTKLRSDLYSSVDGGTRVGLIDLLAVYALFDNDPQAVNRIEAGFASVTPALIQKTAREYLRPTNRSVYTIVAGAK
jgi:zinc protease